MWDLLLVLLQRFGLVAMLGILLMRFAVFRPVISGGVRRREKIVAAVVFGLMGIIGTYGGVPTQGAIANFRAIGPVVGGLIGGPLVGLGAGLLAGGHRMLLGGFTGFSCGLATIVEGGLAGYYTHRYGFKRLTMTKAFLVGVGAELLQMAMILLLSRPFTAAWELVKIIALPMTLTNALGIAVFIAIVQSIRQEQERVGALQAQKALEIANQTVSYFKKGFNAESALHTARIILQVANVSAVAITDGNRILAHLGEGQDHHIAGEPIKTFATRQSLKGATYIARTKEQIGCSDEKCRLASGVVVPLKQGSQVIGTLKLYKCKENAIGSVEINLAEGLAHLFSTQLELAELEQYAVAAKTAEIRALQAQINPHFLFNALNTVSSYCRTDPALARKLLLKLADYFRRNLSYGDKLIPLGMELEHVKSYLAIEQARFGDKVKVRFHIDDSVLDTLLPPLILQPLAENAVKHGLLPKQTGGELEIAVTENEGNVEIAVTDNGVGIRPERLEGLLADRCDSGKGLGIALHNVHSRLCSLYGEEYGLQIASTAHRGTIVKVKIPAAAEVRAS